MKINATRWPHVPWRGWWLRNGRGQGWGRTPFRTTATRSEVGRGMFTRKIWKRKKGLPGTEAEVKRRESLLGPFLVSSSLVHSNKWKPVSPVDVGTALWQHDVYIYIYSCRHWLLLYKHLLLHVLFLGLIWDFFFFIFSFLLLGILLLDKVWWQWTRWQECSEVQIHTVINYNKLLTGILAKNI